MVFLGGTTLTLNADINASSAGFASGHSVGAGCNGGDGQPGLDISYFEGGGGGGGIIGGGGGAAGHTANNFTWSQDFEFDGSPGGGGTATTAGAGGPNGDGHGIAPDGGDANCVGNGGNQDADALTGTFFTVGAGGGGGGSYGGGGAGCSARSSGAYSGGGGGGGSYTGGGSGGYGGTNTGFVSPEEDGFPGNIAEGAFIPDSSHYLNDTDARLMMGGAGGASFAGDSGVVDGGRGGGIVLLAFDEVVGAGGSVLSSGGDGATPTNISSEGPHGSSGSGGGAGGQIAVYADSVADATFTASGGIGGLPVEGTGIQVGLRHTGSAGASGGGGGIWFAGVGSDSSNSGPNAGSTNGDSALAATGLTNVSWAVNGGTPDLANYPDPVTIGSTTYSSTDWAAITGIANLDSGATFKPIAEALVDASAGGFTMEELVATFPYFAQPDNPKNLGLGCGPGFGGNGLAVTSTEVPTSTFPEAPLALGDLVWLDLDRDGVQDADELALVGATVTISGGSLSGPIVVTTDADGFWEVTADDGIVPDESYTVTIDPTTVTNLPDGVSADDLTATTQDAVAGDDETDSDIDPDTCLLYTSDAADE